MNKKRKIKPIPIFLIIVITITIIAFIIYSCSEYSKLKKLNYTNNEIKETKNLNKDVINLIIKNKIEYNKIKNIINNKNYKEENIKEYLTYIKKYDNEEVIINYVNNYKDKYKLNDTTYNFMIQKYFIYDNLDRYINYYNTNKDLKYEEIVARINSNLDYRFYDDSKKADLSKGMYTLVNKFFYLDKNYIPDNLVPTENGSKMVDIAYENFKIMKKAAKEEGLNILITTAFRDYNFQSVLYNNYVKKDGIKNADTYSARPGYSEHQLGYSTDVTNANYVDFGDFDSTKEFEWLKSNAHKYGFILRYPENKEYITGYMYEPWHYRYVGVDIATYIYENNITYEEYYEYFIR